MSNDTQRYLLDNSRIFDKLHIIYGEGDLEYYSFEPELGYTFMSEREDAVQGNYKRIKNVKVAVFGEPQDKIFLQEAEHYRLAVSSFRDIELNRDVRRAKGEYLDHDNGPFEIRILGRSAEYNNRNFRILLSPGDFVINISMRNLLELLIQNGMNKNEEGEVFLPGKYQFGMRGSNSVLLRVGSSAHSLIKEHQDKEIIKCVSLKNQEEPNLKPGDICTSRLGETLYLYCGESSICRTILESEENTLSCGVAKEHVFLALSPSFTKDGKRRVAQFKSEEFWKNDDIFTEKIFPQFYNAKIERLKTSPSGRIRGLQLVDVIANISLENVRKFQSLWNHKIMKRLDQVIHAKINRYYYSGDNEEIKTFTMNDDDWDWKQQISSSISIENRDKISIEMVS